MDTNTPETDINKALAERFAELPPVVQNAITSADVQEHLRGLADTRKLHVDQWQSLENNVMLALLGFQPVEDLPKNLEEDLAVTPEVATELAEDISKNVFEPIRAELELNISSTESTEDAAGEELSASPMNPISSPIVPATPPPAAPTEKAIRGSIAPAYVASASHERKSIEGDPYREQLL